MSVDAININRPQKYSRKVDNNQRIKRTAAISSFVGMSTALALVCKKQGFSLNPKVIANTPIKEWAIFKIAKRGRQHGRPPLQIEEKEILALATGSVAGGLVGGAISDRNNMKAKGREALTQLLGNVITPVACVGGIARLYGKYEKQIKSVMPTVNTHGKKSLRILNKFSRNLPAVTLTGGALAVGIAAGNKVTNLINEKLFGQKTKRHIKTTDFAPHVDDLCLAITLMGSKNSPLASGITRTVPLFLAVPGYQVGKAQEKN